MKRWIFEFIFAGAFWQGCTTYTTELEKVRMEFRTNQFDQALVSLDKSELGKQSRNRLLFLFEKAMILDRLGRRDESRQLLLSADRLIDALYTESVSKSAASFLYNDSVTDYAGEDFEKVAVHSLLALSFLDDQLLDSALVEARKINTKLHEINQNHDKHKNIYGDDAFARYLAGCIYEAKGEIDSAIIDYRKALEVYETVYQKNFGTLPPKSLVRSLYSLLKLRQRFSLAKKLTKTYPWLDQVKGSSKKKSGGTLVVIHELGHLAVKKEKSFSIFVGKQLVRFSFPIISPRNPGRFARTGIALNGIQIAADLVQNLDGIASQTLDDRRARLILKQGVRLALKSQVTQRAEKEFGSLGGLAANIYSAVTETADTRGWTLLPSAWYLTRYEVREGRHTLDIYSDGRKQTRDIEVKPGDFLFIRAKLAHHQPSI